MTFGTGALAPFSYPSQLRALFHGRSVGFVNLGVGGKTTTQLIADFRGKVHPYFKAGAEVIFFEQRNSFIAGVTLAQEQALVQAYVLQAQQLGWRVRICTPPPTADAAATLIDDYNTWLRSNHSFADYFTDVGAAAEFQPPGNATYYGGDATHLNAAGYAVVASTLYAAL